MARQTGRCSPLAGLLAVLLSTACVVRGSVGAAEREELGSSDDTGGTVGGSESTTAGAARDPEPTEGTTDKLDPLQLDLGDGLDLPDDGSNDTTSTGGVMTNAGDCCIASELPGCLDEVLATCVCELDAFCCEVAWDDACVEQATWGPCMGCAPPEPPLDDCCLGMGGRGCADADVQDCVCEHDPYCCMVDWDEVCADQIDVYGCGSCA